MSMTPAEMSEQFTDMAAAEAAARAAAITATRYKNGMTTASKATLHLDVYRGRFTGTLNGVTEDSDVLELVKIVDVAHGYGVLMDEEPRTARPVVLVIDKCQGRDRFRLIPLTHYNAGHWTMMGGNYAGHWDLERKLEAFGINIYGPVPVHDRHEG